MSHEPFGPSISFQPPSQSELSKLLRAYHKARQDLVNYFSTAFPRLVERAEDSDNAEAASDT